MSANGPKSGCVKTNRNSDGLSMPYLPLIYVLGPDVKLLNMSKSTLDYAGIDMEEANTGDFGATVVHPDDIEKFRCDLQEGLARGLTFQLECRARRYDGQYRWFLTLYNSLLVVHGKIFHWY